MHLRDKPPATARSEDAPIAAQGKAPLQMQNYSERVIDNELDELISGAPAIALDGAKGVGKTVTAARRAMTTLALDDLEQRELVAADIGAALRKERPILIDEWQRLPHIWDAVRRAVDAGASPGSFLLTGSAGITGPGTHSGAGRILRVRMYPLSLAERGIETPSVSLGALLTGSRERLEGTTRVALQDYGAEILASGFPGIRSMRDRVRTAQMDGYLARIVDRDFAEANHVVRRPAALTNWLRAYAAATSTVATLETIRDAATGDQSEKPSRASTVSYREVLTRLWILDPVPAWLPTANVMTELTQWPKHHLVDPALAARLLGVTAQSLTPGGGCGTMATTSASMFGPLFESLVAQSARVYAQHAQASLHHLRTAKGRHEVDLIVRAPDHRIVAIEVKLGATVSDDDVRHLHWLRDKLGDELADAIVVTTGSAAYRRADGIGVVPAALLGP